MPYSHETNGKLLRTIGKDRRIKLSEKDKLDIKRKFDAGYSIRGLAREYKVSKRSIQFLLFPERLEQAKKTLEDRGGCMIYYDRLKHNEAMRSTRQWRQKIYNQMITKKMGEIKDAKVCDRSIPGESVPDKDPDKS